MQNRFLQNVACFILLMAIPSIRAFTTGSSGCGSSSLSSTEQQLQYYSVTQQMQQQPTRVPFKPPPLFVKNDKKNFRSNRLSKEELASIESRDMTREEMLALNKQNEDIMNAELAGMTVFSLILSIPMLYLVWVGFFSETAEIAGEL